VFCLKRRCNLFGKGKNTAYCLWEPHVFVSETQGKEKQQNAASCALIMLIN